jgi:hypothetical protein
MTTTLHAFGDSFILGDQDDFLHHVMAYAERVEYLKNNVSFVSILAKHYGYFLKNHSERGSGNFPQLDRLWLNLTNRVIKKGDIVLFGLTTFIRDRFQLINFEHSTSDTKHGPTLIERDLVTKNIHMEKIMEIDFYYLTTSLNRLSEQFDIPIIKFNLFDNALYQTTEETKNLCKVKDFLGYDFNSNTLIDILNDTWGENNVNPHSHTDLKIKKEHESLYTNYRHPSIEGHKKIANWWITNKIIDQHR